MFFQVVQDDKSQEPSVSTDSRLQEYDDFVNDLKLETEQNECEEDLPLNAMVRINDIKLELFNEQPEIIIASEKSRYIHPDVSPNVTLPLVLEDTEPNLKTLATNENNENSLLNCLVSSEMITHVSTELFGFESDHNIDHFREAIETELSPQPPSDSPELCLQIEPNPGHAESEVGKSLNDVYKYFERNSMFEEVVVPQFVLQNDELEELNFTSINELNSQDYSQKKDDSATTENVLTDLQILTLICDEFQKQSGQIAENNEVLTENHSRSQLSLPFDDKENEAFKNSNLNAQNLAPFSKTVDNEEMEVSKTLIELNKIILHKIVSDKRKEEVNNCKDASKNISKTTETSSQLETEEEVPEISQNIDTNDPPEINVNGKKITTEVEISENNSDKPTTGLENDNDNSASLLFNSEVEETLPINTVSKEIIENRRMYELNMAKKPHIKLGKRCKLNKYNANTKNNESSSKIKKRIADDEGFVDEGANKLKTKKPKIASRRKTFCGKLSDGKYNDSEKTTSFIESVLQSAIPNKVIVDKHKGGKNLSDSSTKNSKTDGHNEAPKVSQFKSQKEPARRKSRCEKIPQKQVLTKKDTFDYNASEVTASVKAVPKVIPAQKVVIENKICENHPPESKDYSKLRKESIADTSKKLTSNGICTRSKFKKMSWRKTISGKIPEISRPSGIDKRNINPAKNVSAEKEIPRLESPKKIFTENKASGSTDNESTKNGTRSKINKLSRRNSYCEKIPQKYRNISCKVPSSSEVTASVEAVSKVKPVQKAAIEDKISVNLEKFSKFVKGSITDNGNESTNSGICTRSKFKKLPRRNSCGEKLSQEYWNILKQFENLSTNSKNARNCNASDVPASVNAVPKIIPVKDVVIEDKICESQTEESEEFSKFGKESTVKNAGKKTTRSGRSNLKKMSRRNTICGKTQDSSLHVSGVNNKNINPAENIPAEKEIPLLETAKENFTENKTSEGQILHPEVFLKFGSKIVITSNNETSKSCKFKKPEVVSKQSRRYSLCEKIPEHEKPIDLVDRTGVSRKLPKTNTVKKVFPDNENYGQQPKELSQFGNQTKDASKNQADKPGAIIPQPLLNCRRNSNDDNNNPLGRMDSANDREETSNPNPMNSAKSTTIDAQYEPQTIAYPIKSKSSSTRKIEKKQRKVKRLRKLMTKLEASIRRRQTLRSSRKTEKKNEFNYFSEVSYNDSLAEIPVLKIFRLRKNETTEDSSSNTQLNSENDEIGSNCSKSEMFHKKFRAKERCEIQQPKENFKNDTLKSRKQNSVVSDPQLETLGQETKSNKEITKKDFSSYSNFKLTKTIKSSSNNKKMKDIKTEIKLTMSPAESNGPKVVHEIVFKETILGASNPLQPLINSQQKDSIPNKNRMHLDPKHILEWFKTHCINDDMGGISLEAKAVREVSFENTSYRMVSTHPIQPDEVTSIFKKSIPRRKRGALSKSKVARKARYSIRNKRRHLGKKNVAEAEKMLSNKQQDEQKQQSEQEQQADNGKEQKENCLQQNKEVTIGDYSNQLSELKLIDCPARISSKLLKTILETPRLSNDANILIPVTNNEPVNFSNTKKLMENKQQDSILQICNRQQMNKNQRSAEELSIENIKDNGAQSSGNQVRFKITPSGRSSFCGKFPQNVYAVSGSERLPTNPENTLNFNASQLTTSVAEAVNPAINPSNEISIADKTNERRQVYPVDFSSLQKNNNTTIDNNPTKRKVNFSMMDILKGNKKNDRNVPNKLRENKRSRVQKVLPKPAITSPLLPCMYCDEKFQSINEYTKHITASHTPWYPCTACPAKFVSTTALNAHTSVFHEANAPSLCTKCGQTFDSNVLMLSHSVTCSGDQRPPPPWARTTKPMFAAKESPVAQPYSGVPLKISKRRSTVAEPLIRYQAAQYNMMNQQNWQQFPCHACKITFPTLAALNAHLELHVPFNCARCHKNFPTFVLFNSHIAMCNNSVYGRINENVQRIGNDRFKCDNCKISFEDEFQFHFHIRQIHGMQQYFF